MDSGKDLSVLPFLVAYDAESIDLVARSSPTPPNTLDVLRCSFPKATVFDASPAELVDLAVFGGRENLAQALILRLLTPRGALASLGHAGYGSRLGELIGQRKNPATRALCRAYVLEVVAQEPRVEDTAVALDFDVDRETPSSFVFTLAVQSKSGGDPVAVSLEVGL